MNDFEIRKFCLELAANKSNNNSLSQTVIRNAADYELYIRTGKIRLYDGKEINPKDDVSER